MHFFQGFLHLQFIKYWKCDRNSVWFKKRKNQSWQNWQIWECFFTKRRERNDFHCKGANHRLLNTMRWFSTHQTLGAPLCLPPSDRHYRLLPQERGHFSRHAERRRKLDSNRRNVISGRAEWLALGGWVQALHIPLLPQGGGDMMGTPSETAVRTPA